MSGHSKWSTIKRRKGSVDAKRSKAFTKALREISGAVREGGSDPLGNPRLRLAISNAKGENMPKENIQRAINKASDKSAADLIKTTYEGYASGGIAVFIECLTDNINRTVSNIRTIFTKAGGTLGKNGSLQYLFDRKGVFTLPAPQGNEDDFILTMIDEGAEDIEKEEDAFLITTSFENFGKIQKKLEEKNITPENARIQMIPKITKKVDI